MLNKKRLLLFLDGLDELKTVELQKSCVESLNQYLTGEQAPEYTVICSRTKEYRLLPRLELNGAIQLKPLSEEQIQDYLAAVGQDDLWSVVSKDAQLLDLVQTPLMLSVAALVYKEVSPEEWARSKSSEDRKQILWDAYLRKRMEPSFRNSRVYKREKQIPHQRQTRQWLTWLALQMHYQGRTEFSLEDIQPWMLTRSEQVQMRIIHGTISAFVVGLFGFLMAGPIGSISGMIGGGVLSYKAALLDIWTVEQLKFTFKDGMRKELADNMKSALIPSSLGGLISGSILGLIWLLQGKSLSGILAGEILGQIWSLTVTAVYTITESFRAEIQNKAFPGQGIHWSLKNMLLLSLLAIPVAGIFWLAFPKLLVNLLGAELTSRIVVGAIGFLLICITMFGGAEGFSHHYILRFILSRSNKMPFRYVRFLNYCKERSLLNQVGGRSSFIHMLLREHLVNISYPILPLEES